MPDDLVLMPVITEPFLSVDKITLLINTGPQFSFVNSTLDLFNKKMESFIEEMIKDCKRNCPGSFDFSKQFAESTELYHHHYRLAGGIDLQLCPKFGIRNRVYDDEYIKCFYGSAGYMAFENDGYFEEKIDSSYGVRLEFNPSKDNLTLCASFLKYFCNKYCNPEILFDELFKISRLDIAVDYPIALNPCLFSSLARRGNQHFGANGIETLYLGTRRSSFQFRIYDKKQELLKEHKTHYAGSDLWRIELESRPAINIGEDLNFYSEVFSKLNYFYGMKTEIPEHDWFLNYAKQYGVYNAFNSIKDASKKKHYKNFFHRQIEPNLHSLKHPKEIVGWQFPKLWREFYDDLKVYCGRENDAPLYPRNLKETI